MVGEKSKITKDMENIEKIIEEYKEYAKENDFELNPNKKTVEWLIGGLLENKKKYGQRYCPCRRVSGHVEEDRAKICPCVWHQEEIKRDGHCCCRLFIKIDRWKK